MVIRSGRLFVLSLMHLDDDRNMTQNIHDLIELSNQRGHSDIFLTRTGNPNWPKITDAQFSGRRTQDCHEILARASHGNVPELIAFVIDGKHFGKLIANVRIIKFHKTGLSFAHCIFIVSADCKVYQMQQSHFHKLVSVEIPSCEQ